MLTHDSRVGARRCNGALKYSQQTLKGNGKSKKINGRRCSAEQTITSTVSSISKSPFQCRTGYRLLCSARSFINQRFRNRSLENVITIARREWTESPCPTMTNNLCLRRSLSAALAPEIDEIHFTSPGILSPWRLYLLREFS